MKSCVFDKFGAGVFWDLPVKINHHGNYFHTNVLMTSGTTVYFDSINFNNQFVSLEFKPAENQITVCQATSQFNKGHFSANFWV